MPMSVLQDGRRARRIVTRFESLYSSGRCDGTGVLADVSYSGAHVGRASTRPEIGALVRLFVFLRPSDPFELIGRVVRHTDDGFAVELQDLEVEIGHFVDDAVAFLRSSSR